MEKETLKQDNSIAVLGLQRGCYTVVHRPNRGPEFVFVNKVLLGPPPMPIHFPMMKGHCQTAMPESSPSMATDCNATVHHKRDCVAWDTSNTYDLVLYQKQIYQPLV